MTKPPARSTRRAAIGVCAAITLAALPGCYTRVVDAKGIGADQQHPRQSERTEPARDFFNTTSDKKND